MGYTDTDGNFSINWADNDVSYTTLTVRVKWYAIHEDGRFQVGNTGLWTFTTSSTFEAVNGQTTDIGTRDWGNNPHANVYDGAVKLWQTLKTSNRLYAYFGAGAPQCPSGISCGTRTNVMISDTGKDFNGNSNSCPSGAAWGSQNWICLPDTDFGHYANLGRVMHELGHIAEYVSQRDQEMYWYADYRRDDPPECATNPNGPTCNIHTYTSAEWHSAQWSEAIADHFAHVGLYASNHAAPFTCVALDPCDSSNGFGLETLPGNCNDQHRWQLTSERYLWDAYDDAQDSGRGYTDTIDEPDPGWGNNDRDEVLNSSLQATDENGHSTLDFMEVWTGYGTDTEDILRMNCRPQGALNDNS